MLRNKLFMSSTVLSLVSFAAFAQAGDAGRAKELFQEGMTLFRQGQYEEALVKLQASLQEEPDAATASEIFQTTESALWLQMLSQDAEFEKIASSFMQLANSAKREKSDDAEAIQALVEKIKSGDFTTRRRASYQLLANHGEFAVPALVHLLGSNAPAEHRLNAMSALANLGGEATLPLCLVLKTSDMELKRGALFTLGRIADIRSIPFVQEVAQMEKDAPTREIAQKTAREIALKTGTTSGGSAHDLYCEMGEAALRGENSIVRAGGQTIWHFSDETGLKGTPTPADLYAHEIARIAFQGALALDPNSKKAANGLVLAYGATVTAAEPILSRGDETAAPLALRAELGLAASGKANLDKGLAAASAAGQSPVAKSVTDALARVGTPGTPEYPAVLNAALQSSDKRMRYAAAISLARETSEGAHASAASIVAALASSVGEQTVRIVSVVDENASRRESVTAQLRNAGYYCVEAESGAIALAQIRRYGAADLIVMSATLSDVTTDQVLTEFADDERTREIPVFLLAEKRSIEKVSETFADRVAKIADGSMALDLGVVAEAVARRENPDRTMAEEMTREAAISLAALDPSQFDLRPAAASLLTAIRTKKDATAISAAQAMGHAGSLEHAEGLIAILGDAQRSTELRATVGVAIARIFSRAQTVSSAQIEALAKILREETNPEIRKAAAIAIGGVSNLAPVDRVKVFCETLATPAPSTKKEETENSNSEEMSS